MAGGQSPPSRSTHKHRVLVVVVPRLELSLCSRLDRGLGRLLLGPESFFGGAVVDGTAATAAAASAAARCRPTSSRAAAKRPSQRKP